MPGSDREEEEDLESTPQDDEDQACEDERLEQGLENTFPASDPPAVKHIT